MYEIEVEIEGVRPLLQHRFDMESQSGKKGKKKTGEIDYRAEAEKALYMDGKGTIYEPADHVEGAMFKAASNFQIRGKGKKTYKSLVRSTIFIKPEAIPHLIPEYVIDAKPVVVNRSRVIRYRPRFDKWKLSFTIEVRDDQFPIEVVQEILEHAGYYEGIGDYRPRYGTFRVTSFQQKE